MKFDFTDSAGVVFDSIGLLDFDEDKLPEFMVKFVGQDELIKFKFDETDRLLVCPVSLEGFVVALQRQTCSIRR